jgi:hypothetical protein
MEAELDNILELTADFVGPMGGLSAQLGEDNRTMVIDFVGPSPFISAELETALGLNANFVGPKGVLAASLENPLDINAGFVGPMGHLDAFISRGPRVDVFFRGPVPRMNADLELNFPPTEAQIEYTFKKYIVEITVESEANSTLTFLLIQP